MYFRSSENAKYGFYRNMDNFEMVIVVSKTSHICYKPVSTEYLKVGTCSPKALNVSDR